MDFFVERTDFNTKARIGHLKTAHGIVETPVFMPVGTQAAVKALKTEDLEKIGFEIMLSNTYHLFLRPGIDVIKNAGGLHKFMSWGRAILTDSGGYQIYSLSDLRKISEEGVWFSSHIDGRKLFMGPKECMEIQNTLGSDIMMVLDECPPYPSDRKYAKKSMELSLKWAKECKKYHKDEKRYLFAIVQGATYDDLRKECAERLMEEGFDSYAIGGLSVGEPKTLMYHTADLLSDILPLEKPRYLMGAGTPEDLVQLVSLGIDMFDCVMPTRNARNGTAFTWMGKITVRNSAYKYDNNPIDEKCKCFVCRKYSRSYIRHLFNAKEMLGPILVTYHNLYFYNSLMKKMRKAIKDGKFESFKKNFIRNYNRK